MQSKTVSTITRLRLVLRWLWRIVALLVLVWVGGIGALWLYGRVDRAQPAEVIVVLGARVSPDGRLSPALYRRVTHAFALWQKGLAPKILCTGGNSPDEGTQIEAVLACARLQALGVPASALLLEKRATSTAESAVYCAEILQTLGIQRAILVSDHYHLARTEWLFAQAGITGYPSPAQASIGRLSTRNFLRFASRELLAFGWSWLSTTVSGRIVVSQ